MKRRRTSKPKTKTADATATKANARPQVRRETPEAEVRRKMAFKPEKDDEVRKLHYEQGAS